MRISSVLISTALVSASEKKVPPRHPSGRLRTLSRFTEEWLNKNFRNLLPADHKGDDNGERIANRFSKRFKNWIGRMRGLIDDQDKDCFFFDPTSAHGGRTRRQTLPEAADESETNLDRDYDYSEYADDLVRYDKNNPQRGLRQITTGLRKWALRYISECPGEKELKKQHSKRADNLYRKILSEYNGFFKKFKSNSR